MVIRLEQGLSLTALVIKPTCLSPATDFLIARWLASDSNWSNSKKKLYSHNSWWFSVIQLYSIVPPYGPLPSGQTKGLPAVIGSTLGKKEAVDISNMCINMQTNGHRASEKRKNVSLCEIRLSENVTGVCLFVRTLNYLLYIFGKLEYFWMINPSKYCLNVYIRVRWRAPRLLIWLNYIHNRKLCSGRLNEGVEIFLCFVFSSIEHQSTSDSFAVPKQQTEDFLWPFL